MKPKVFSESIFPDFPFVNNGWRAIAFERDNYDCARMPKWFFDLAVSVFSENGDGVVQIDMIDENISAVQYRLCLKWECYHDFMLANYSPEYFLTDPGARWGCWIDNEMTVWGGQSSAMMRIFDSIGGVEAVLQFMRNDFFLIDPPSNEKFDAYLVTLVRGRGEGKGDGGS